MVAACPALELQAVTRRFPARRRGEGVFTAMEAFSFSVRPRESIAVVGPHAHAGFTLQKDLLLPRRNIRRNAAFRLKARGVSAAGRATRVTHELGRCRLTGHADRYPHQLSGGRGQRVTLARRLAIEPYLVLLDQPFSALDAQTKTILQRSFARTIAASGVTTRLITHDLNEAVAMSDRNLVIIERPGSIVEELAVDLPDRDATIGRQASPRGQQLVAQLFDALHLNEFADA